LGNAQGEPIYVLLGTTAEEVLQLTPHLLTGLPILAAEV
jgi:hypothetical protein